jgi:hypothetical protein
MQNDKIIVPEPFPEAAGPTTLPSSAKNKKLKDHNPPEVYKRVDNNILT